MVQWESIVALAREVDGEHANGVLDPVKAARLARAVLRFQEQLSAPGVRTTRPPLASAPVLRAAEPAGEVLDAPLSQAS
jgi:hypothetical protein